MNALADVEGAIRDAPVPHPDWDIRLTEALVPPTERYVRPADAPYGLARRPVSVI